MCEYMETQQRLQDQNVFGTITIFGSARCLPRDKWEVAVKKLKNDLNDEQCPKKKEKLEEDLTRLEKLEYLCDYMEMTYELSKKIAQWTLTDEARDAMDDIMDNFDDIIMGGTTRNKEISRTGPSPLVICTGGGPGLMEAANKGAYDVPGARSAGMGVTLPFEGSLNPYVTPELAFEFHYFFTRKFWMVYTTLALIAAPGGIGTLDELCEVMTLKQTQKLKRDIPIVLLGKEFWRNVINFDYLAEKGTIADRDRKSVFYTDSVDEAFEYIRSTIVHKKGILLYAPTTPRVPSTRANYNTLNIMDKKKVYNENNNNEEKINDETEVAAA
eukprot:GHVR01171939.1.p1 GENE.GHVR01171939.1~~GHVR01171939.1.p1  ORF type:complete len:328 (-),score=88.99 GHVR01171939.1:347-1330(-)